MRHWLAFAAATAFGAAGAPALAQNAPPPPPAAPPAWVDPQAPQGPVVPGGPYGAQALPAGPAYPGAPFAQPHPPGVVPGMPVPPPGGYVYGATGGAGPVYGANYGYTYGYQPGAGAPCGCGCCGGGYTVTWVPIRIETRYSYSAPIRHERDVVENTVVPQEVVETKTVPVRESKYVRSVKPTKGKVVRTTK
jgi:hypothetical protein